MFQVVLIHQCYPHREEPEPRDGCAPILFGNRPVTFKFTSLTMSSRSQSVERRLSYPLWASPFICLSARLI